MACNINAIKVIIMMTAKGKIIDILAIRLQRGDEVTESIRKACLEHDVKNAVIISMIGSLYKTTYYDPIINPKIKSWISYGDPISLECPVQLLSGNGEVCYNQDGELDVHIHVSLADSQGNSYGGHLAEQGNQALCTVNIFVGILEGIEMGFEYEDIMGKAMLFMKQVDN
jgi:predicted DNA-binding protein with PD1-like motif